MHTGLTRRSLVAAGLSAAFLSALPESCLAADFSPAELAEIGPGASATALYKPDVAGAADKFTTDALLAFANWAIAAWGFRDIPGERPDIADYPKLLPGIIHLKTTGQKSYLAEYHSAAELIVAARHRLGSPEAAFVHLMFNGRSDKTLKAPRLTRARRFVFDEFVRHLVSHGGFRTFGFVNYEGYMGGSVYDEKSFRQGGPA